MQVNSRAIPRLEAMLCTQEHFDTRKFDSVFRTKRFAGYYTFIDGSSDSVYDRRKWLYEARFRVGMFERFRNEVVVLFPRVMTDKDGHRGVERPIEVRVDGNLGPLSVSYLLEKIASELGCNSGAAHLIRNNSHEPISSIRT